MLKFLSGLLAVLAVVLPCGTGLCQVHDVGVISLSAPPDTVWPGDPWFPTATVKNFGDQTESVFVVVFRLCPAFVDTIKIWDLGPGEEQEAMAMRWLPPNTVCIDCSLRVCTGLASDQDSSNNCMGKTIRIGEYQISLDSMASPGDTVIADSFYVPEVTAGNSGPKAESLNIECLIGAVYGDTQQVPDLPPGQQAQVQFTPWHVPLAETVYALSFRILDSLDCDTTDNYLEKQVFANWILHDCAPVVILSPPESVGTNDTVVVQAYVTNFGEAGDSFDVSCVIGDYSETTRVSFLAPAETTLVNFPDWIVPPVSDTFAVVVATLLPGDRVPGNDTLTDTTISYENPGVNEDRAVKSDVNNVFVVCDPNPFVKSVAVNWSAGLHTQAVLQVYDVTGRLVRTLAVSSIPGRQTHTVWDGKDAAGKEMESGVYFICLKAGYEMSYAKVVRVR
jgi:hypothetical protein